MNRRGFLGSILVACAAPAIVRADSLMRIVPRETLIDTQPVASLEAQIRRKMAALKEDIEHALINRPGQILQGADIYRSEWGTYRAIQCSRFA